MALLPDPLIYGKFDRSKPIHDGVKTVGEPLNWVSSLILWCFWFPEVQYIYRIKPNQSTNASLLCVIGYKSGSGKDASEQWSNYSNLPWPSETYYLRKPRSTWI